MEKYQKYQIFTTTPQTGVQTETVVNTTSSESLAAEIKEHWIPTMLDNLKSLKFHTQFGKNETMPKHRGHFVEFRRWNTISATNENGELVELVEGITPDPDEFGVNTVTTELVSFGKWIPVTDALEDEAFDNIILGASTELTETAADQLDLYTRNQLLAGTNAKYAAKKTFNDDGKVTARTTISNPSQIDNTCILDAYEVHMCANRLSAAKVPKIDGSYVSIIHPSVEFDLTESKGWQEAHVYASPEEIFNGEIGKLQGVRFSVTSNAKVWGKGDLSVKVGEQTYANTTTAVYASLFMGKDAYAVIHPENRSFKLYIKRASESGTADPLEQRNTVGYKFATASCILDENRIIKLYCASKEFGDLDTTN